MSKVFVYDPTQKDEKGRVRGMGRYISILKENFGKEFTFTSDLSKVKKDSIFINPALNLLAPPLRIGRIAKHQVGVIYDIIPLKYPSHFPLGIRGKINLFLSLLSARQYDLFITISQKSREDLLDFFKSKGIRKEIKVIYIPLSKKLRQSKKEVERNDLVKNLPPRFCLYVGDATWNKNLVNLAKAIQIINVPCVIVGKVFKTKGELSHPEENELKRFLTLVKNDKRFIITGYVDDIILSYLYKKATLNILISRDEGFGLSFLEAASFSTPSLLSDIPIFHEIAQNSALFANPLDIYEIANKIGELYFNPNLRDKLGTAAKKRSEFFSAKKFREGVLQVLRDLEEKK